MNNKCSDTLNLVMIVKNEERCLGRCLENVRELVDDIILVDTGSTDRTQEIAAAYGAKIYDFQWKNDFSAARNYALDQSSSDWNLVLDADEYLTVGTRGELMQNLSDFNCLGAIQIRSAYQDGCEISYGISYITRLLPRGVRFIGRIHEQADSELPRKPLPLVFDHDGYLKPMKTERNLPILLEELRLNPQDPYFLYQTAESLRVSDPQRAIPYYEQFYQYSPREANYRVRGVVGYVYTLVETKNFETGLWLIEQEESQLSDYADFEFACGIFFMKLVLWDTSKYIAYLPHIEASYLRCLRIGEVPRHNGVLGTGSFKASYNLGAWYEVSGNMDKAGEYYQLSEYDKKRMLGGIRT